MSDQDTPEIHHDKSSKKPNMFSWYTPLTDAPKKFTEADDVPSLKEDSMSEKEELFRAAAIKCAQMEEELSVLMAKRLGDNRFASLKGEVYLHRLSNLMELSSYEEPFQGIEGGQLDGKVHVDYWDSGTDLADHARKLGINTPRKLVIGIHMDEPTQEVYF